MESERNRYRVFPETASRVTPQALYEAVYPSIPQPRSEVYISSPLTSGGARRLFDDPLADDAIPTIFRINSTFAETIAREVEDILPAEQVTLPHHLGSREGWQELDYMKFWMNFISGIAPEAAATFAFSTASSLGINLEAFNTYSLPREKRAVQYERLVDGFVAHVKKINPPLNPVAGIICLPDHGLSVGCSAETRLARALGIPIQEVAFNETHPRYEGIVEAAPWLSKEPRVVPQPSTSPHVIIFSNLT